MNKLPESLETELVDYILNNEPQEKSLHPETIKARGRDEPINGKESESEPINGKESESWWLGRHKDMQSPGRITLHRDRIGNAFWACIQDLDGNVDTKTDATSRRILCQSLVFMVLVHERFHHFCDVLGRVTGYRGGAKADNTYKQDWKSEEALATAWEWQEVQRSFVPFSHLPITLRKTWMQWWFNEITAEGYRDWKLCVRSCCFKTGLARHLVASDTNSTLQGTGCELSNSLYAQFLSPGWCDTAVTYWKATNNYPETELTANSICMPIATDSLAQQWIEPDDLVLRLCHENRETLQDIHKTLVEFKGMLCLNGNPITSHVLGLLLIKGLQQISLCGLTGDLLKVIEILNQHLPNTKGNRVVLECQHELEDAGFEDFAWL